MTIERARKILGKMAENIPDAELEKEIKAAELLKTLFFAHNTSPVKQKSLYNKNTNGKT